MPKTVVSIIITILNGEKWIEQCFEGIFSQYIPNEINLEIICYNDSSQDETIKLLKTFKKICLKKNNINMIIVENSSTESKGVGFGRNNAIKYSTGQYLCFQDIDDIMLPNRINHQYNLAKFNHNAIVGSKFIRLPEDSTKRFSFWANNLEMKKLSLQIYTSNGPTIIMPTWFCHRKVFNRVEGFCEERKGIPEDLIFFYKHLDLGGTILRCDEILLIYTYHREATTFSINADTIWKIRLKHLIENVLLVKNNWQNGFIIWNAGRQGRKFFRDLPREIKLNVKGFCDVDKKKINKTYNYYDKITRRNTYSIPIIHFKDAIPPIIICVKLDLTKGIFEENLKSLHLIEGKDYIVFS